MAHSRFLFQKMLRRRSLSVAAGLAECAEMPPVYAIGVAEPEFTWEATDKAAALAEQAGVAAKTKAK
jgi:hypothetical protein